MIYGWWIISWADNLAALKSYKDFKKILALWKQSTLCSKLNWSWLLQDDSDDDILQGKVLWDDICADDVEQDSGDEHKDALPDPFPTTLCQNACVIVKWIVSSLMYLRC